jgi:hypothetical protein
VRLGALDEARRLIASIPLIGDENIPLIGDEDIPVRDEIELEIEV